jgi:hypothetical protein
MTDAIEIDPAAICERGVITAGEVLAMRRAFYAEGIITSDEADAIFAINNSCREQAADWSDLFVEALTDFIVQQAEPQGYVTVENAEWLIARIAVDGIVQSRTELELLVHVMETARWSPASLARFALEQVKLAIIDGAGPLASSQAPVGIVSAHHVQLLRRILFAFGSDGTTRITRGEAEVLFEIADATDEARNDPAWSDLFSKAIASSMMIESGYVAPSREAVLREEAWLEEDADVAGFLGRMVSGGLSNVWGSWRVASAEDMQLEKLERDRQAMLTEEVITQTEASWLADRIGRDGRTSECERAVLSFLRRESPSIHPALQPLLDRAA